MGDPDRRSGLRWTVATAIGLAVGLAVGALISSHAAEAATDWDGGTRIGDSLQMQIQVSDGVTGKMLGAFESARAPLAAPMSAVTDARTRVMGFLAQAFDERYRRQMARERVQWCRHLVMLEDLSKSKDPSIAYSELPSRICRCEKLHWESKGESVDPESVIRDFKTDYCESCKAREPKNGSGTK